MAASASTKLQPQTVAQTVGFAGALAYQDLAALVVAEEFLAEPADRDQPVGAGAVEGGEQAERVTLVTGREGGAEWAAM